MNIYYGSQSGNCEEIAKILKSRIEEECNIQVHCDTLNSLTSEISLDSKINNISYVFVISSTYGNGDPPENAARLWRMIKNRKMNKLLFEDVKFAVLALGNSNYDRFCNFGKNIDKRLEELSGTRILDLVCIDDIADMEDFVTNWCNEIIEKVKNQLL
jgi:sulfite reductase (NADPH) flavoprotein alpha-component